MIKIKLRNGYNRFFPGTIYFFFTQIENAPNGVDKAVRAFIIWNPEIKHESQQFAKHDRAFVENNTQ